MNICAYPAFEPLQKHHRDFFAEEFRAYPPAASEFTFTNLYAWREAYQFQVSRLEQCLIVQAGSGTFLSPAGGRVKPAMEKVLADGGRFIRVPQETAQLVGSCAGLQVEHDPDNDDYVFNVADLVALAGRKYDGKRNLIKNFKAQYPYQYIDLDASHVEECLAFKEKWCLLKDCDSVESLRNEKKAVREMILNCAYLGLMGGAITVNSEIAALAIAEPLNPQTLVLHVLKAHANMTGLYQVMLNEFLAHRAAGFACVNMEQDLGVPGLRKFKESYYPAFMIRKFTLTRAHADP